MLRVPGGEGTAHMGREAARRQVKYAFRAWRGACIIGGGVRLWQSDVMQSPAVRPTYHEIDDQGAHQPQNRHARDAEPDGRHRRGPHAIARQSGERGRHRCRRGRRESGERLAGGERLRGDLRHGVCVQHAAGCTGDSAARNSRKGHNLTLLHHRHRVGHQASMQLCWWLPTNRMPPPAVVTRASLVRETQQLC
jgi:hypothetical protein